MPRSTEIASLGKKIPRLNSLAQSPSRERGARLLEEITYDDLGGNIENQGAVKRAKEARVVTSSTP